LTTSNHDCYLGLLPRLRLLPTIATSDCYLRLRARIAS
jgi:hypothetical protein